MSSGLSSLLGQYMSDSDNDDEQNNSSTNTNHQKQLKLNKNKTEEYFSSPITAWTQCVDPVTEHPYYWNIETKEVTWDKPDEYEKYINYVYKKLSNIPDNCWVIGYTEDNKTPYYVNEYTRVVSWKKPLNFKEPIHNNTISSSLSTTTSNNSNLNINNNCNTNNNHGTNPTQELKLTDAVNKRNDNKAHLEKKHSKKIKKNVKTHKKNSEFNLKNNKNYSDTEEKIELINSYSASSESSSDGETEKKNENKRIQESQKQKNIKNKIGLVAAVYETDDEEDDDDKFGGNSNKLKLSTKKLFPKTIDKDENNAKEINNENNTNSGKNDLKTDSFASIITGGKLDLIIDEEINRLKMELGRELPGFESSQQSTDENNTKTTVISLKMMNENCFDEKQFQRKKRIQFNTSNNKDNIKQTITQNIGIPTVCNESEISPQSTTDLLETLKENQRKNLYNNFTKSHVEFGDNNNSKDSSSANQDETRNKPENSCESSTNNDNGDDDDDNNHNVKLQIDDLSDLLIGKVKFLSVGRPEVSTVQLMSIQLETLLAAYRSSSLNADYFFKWLKTISDDLRKLEQTAIPDGWECKWDRQNSQYHYKNLETSEIRWDFPVTDIDDNNKINYKNDSKDLHVKNKKLKEEERKDERERHHHPHQQQQLQQNDGIVNEALGIIQGEDEMDISTTPPPNEHEQIKFMGNWTADNPPPPPTISSEPSLSADYYSTIAKPKSLTGGSDINCELASFYSDLASLETTKKPIADPTAETIVTTDGAIIPVITDNADTISPIIVSQLLGPPLLSVANDNNNINAPTENLPTSITAITITTTTANASTTTITSDDSGQSCSSSSVVSLQVDVDLKQNKKKKKLTEDDASNACNSNIIPKKRKKIKVQGMGQKMKEVSTLVAKWQKVRKELDS